MRQTEVLAIRYILDQIKKNERLKYRSDRLLDKIELNAVREVWRVSLSQLIEALDKESKRICKAEARTATWRTVKRIRDEVSMLTPAKIS